MLIGPRTNVTAFLLHLLSTSKVGSNQKEATLLHNNNGQSSNVFDASWLNWEGSGCHFSVYEPDECATPQETTIRKRKRAYVRSMNVFRNSPKPESREKRSALKCQRWLWPNGIIPYHLEISNPEIVTKFQAAKEEIERSSCVEFRALNFQSYGQNKRRRKRAKKKYLLIRETLPIVGKSCQASVGRVNSRPYMNLSTTCSKGQILHELLHVLGFLHEHARPDRNRFVKIHCENILPGLTADFRRLKAEVVDTLDEPYDFYSIMHYRFDHFSKNGLPTIQPLDPEIDLNSFGKMERLSPADKRKLNALYSCHK